MGRRSTENSVKTLYTIPNNDETNDDVDVLCEERTEQISTDYRLVWSSCKG